MTTRIRFSKKAEKMLREVGKKYKFIRSGPTIRYFKYTYPWHDEYCPMKCIAKDMYPDTNWFNGTFCDMHYPTESQYNVAQKLGLSTSTIAKIVDAADNPNNLYRSRLEHLLGIKGD